MAAGGWQTAAAALAILTPLVVVPLTVITFHLRGLREHQLGRYADFARKLEVLETTVRHLNEELSAVQRNYTTKEEWLREVMWARGRIETLSDSMTRVEIELEPRAAPLATAEGTARTVSQIGQRLEGVNGAAVADTGRGKE